MISTSQNLRSFCSMTSQIPQMNPYTGINSVLVSDNAVIHQSNRINKIFQAARFHLIYLPPYCPKLGFAAIKSKLRWTQELTVGPLMDYLPTVEIMTTGFFYSSYKHCG
ncbi:hypothetical protein VP01_27g9 [Puccinia sorghi]|uniref:Tc1-like transposase DDE domain-containing protein n=1 Tax=Puccinia sorghi TaxID=27349 RepID=A0A0L6V2J1_9BASI|nr:hypothetical protein VP01_27g9 [Puccinia sorghi]